MFEMSEYIKAFKDSGVKAAEEYRMKHSPKKLYKFIPLYDRGNPVVNRRNMETLVKKEIWASKYMSLNDPYEFNAMYLDEEKIRNSGNSIDTFEDYKKFINDSFFTVSFCAERDIHPLNNLPMWAYYSNNHHGVCVEYEVVNPICLYPVSYENDRTPMTTILGNFVSLALDAVNGVIEPDNPELIKYQFLMLNILCMKHKSWSNENEFRILYPDIKKTKIGQRLAVEDIGIRISAIYLGKDCSVRNKNKMKEIAKELGVSIYQMKIGAKYANFGMEYNLC